MSKLDNVRRTKARVAARAVTAKQETRYEEIFDKKDEIKYKSEPVPFVAKIALVIGLSIMFYVAILEPKLDQIWNQSLLLELHEYNVSR